MTVFGMVRPLGMAEPNCGNIIKLTNEGCNLMNLQSLLLGYIPGSNMRLQPEIQNVYRRIHTQHTFHAVINTNEQRTLMISQSRFSCSQNAGQVPLSSFDVRYTGHNTSGHEVNFCHSIPQLYSEK